MKASCIEVSQFVDIPKYVLESVTCPIGLGIFNDPVQLTTCPHTFCRKCIEIALENSAKCPACKVNANMKDVVINKVAKDLIDKLTIKCRNSERKEKVEYENLNRHLNEECLFSTIKCTLGCKAKFLRKDKNNHAEVCPEATLICDYDFVAYKRRNKETHMKECPKMIIKCEVPNCNMSFRREQLDAHLQNECTENELECQYRNVGCSFKGKRSDREKH